MSYRCNECTKQYHTRSALNKHSRIKHNVIKRQQVQCFHCNQLCGSKTKLIVHLRLHKKQRRRRLKCPYLNCNYNICNYSSLHKHLQQQHFFPLQEEALQFNNEYEFMEWKKQTEEKYDALYVRDTAPKCLKDNIRAYYICHRSYQDCLQIGRKKSLKSSGTNKIGVACPSILIVSNVNNKLFIKFYPKHAGHECEIGRMKLSNDERREIAGKLSEGVTVQRILDDVRDEATTSTRLKRIHLLEKKDIHNIKKEFSIGYPTKRHENDAISVKLWVEHMKGTEFNPVLLYKEQGQDNHLLNIHDFILVLMTQFQKQQLLKFGNAKICIDGTHGLNNYDFQLFSLMIVDDYGCGIPVAFCFSNRSDIELFKIYFNCIKECVGVINAQVFMSDDAPAFYNAWQSVMTPVSYPLLCSWHVNRNWIQNLTKITNTDKRSLVFKTLQVLRNEVSEENFCKQLNLFINELQSDQDTNQFGEYFINHYANRPKKWAYCFRQYLGINTNMYLEALHKTIKYCYLDGKQCKRLDKTINALLNLVRDKVFERLIKLSKHKLTAKIKKIVESHPKSTSITSNMITTDNEGNWFLYSSKDSTHKYIVQNITLRCELNCQLKCNECNICVHTFKCSCTDNIINYNICKHIHAIASINLISKNRVQENSEDNCKEVFGLLDPVEELTNLGSQDHIKKKAELILGLNSRVRLDENSLKIVTKCLDKAIAVMNKGQVAGTSQSNINVRKNIDPQVRFHSTRRKKKKEPSQPQMPSHFERNVIREGLLGQELIINVNTTFDHTYATISDT